MNVAVEMLRELYSMASTQHRASNMKFFKKKWLDLSQDIFIGVPVPKIRSIVQKYYHRATLADAENLLKHNIEYNNLNANAIFIGQNLYDFADNYPLIKETASYTLKDRQNIQSTKRIIEEYFKCQASDDDNNKESKFYHAKNLTFADLALHCNNSKHYIHEQKTLALLLMVKLVQTNKTLLTLAMKIYLKNLEFINNWDLVDCSCYHIVGESIVNNVVGIDILKNMAASENIWHRRAAIVSTLALIRNGNLQPTIDISILLMKDSEDLIHKAIGWMLRETGKKNIDILMQFLQLQCRNFHATTISYAMERMDNSYKKKIHEIRKQTN